MEPSSEFSHHTADLSAVTSYKAGILQAQAYRTLRRLADESLQQEGLTSMQWFTIGAVHDAGIAGISVSVLSDLLGTNIPFVTNTVNELVSRSLLVKTQASTDARARLVTVHPDFLIRIPAIEDRVRRNLRRTVYARVTPHELALYITLLSKLSASA